MLANVPTSDNKLRSDYWCCPALEVMKLRGRDCENFPEASWLVEGEGARRSGLKESSFMDGDGLYSS